MGCDGGTIPRRDELVRLRKKRPQKDRNALRSARWNNCALSQLPLRKPIVACRKGRMYNKDELLKALIERKCEPELYTSIAHIRKLRKDTRDLSLVENPDYYETSKDTDLTPKGRFMCPLTTLDMNGTHKFVFFWDCGCVMSERALQCIDKPERCLKCDSKCSNKQSLVHLNPKEESVTREEKKRSKKHSKKTIHHKSIQNDQAKSSVYKSLFTSSDAAKRQKTAHWTTYNPQYF